MPIDSFESYPQISLKKLQDGDVLSTLKEKIQYNFDQIYLHTINVILKGNDGERGWSGLSIIGEKGDKGDVGAMIHYDNTATNGGISNPLYAVGDIIIADDGKHYEVVAGSPNTYNLVYTPTALSFLVDELSFFSLGSITNHKLRFWDQNSKGSNLVLASRIAGDAEYYRLILGSNSYVSNSLESITITNILGNPIGGGSSVEPAFGANSRDFSQLKIKYRDTQSSIDSLTSLDIKYYIKSLVEYSVLKNNQATVSIKNNPNTGVSEHVINTDYIMFTSGISNHESADQTNSLFVRKTLGNGGTIPDYWHISAPAGDDIFLGNTQNIVVSTSGVGIFKSSPTHSLDINGTYKSLSSINGTGIEHSDTEVYLQAMTSWVMKMHGVGIEIGSDDFSESHIILEPSQAKVSFDQQNYMRVISSALEVRLNNTLVGRFNSTSLATPKITGLYNGSASSYILDISGNNDILIKPTIGGFVPVGAPFIGGDVTITGGGGVVNGFNTAGNVNISGGFYTSFLGTVIGDVVIESNVKMLDTNLGINSVSIPSPNTNYYVTSITNNTVGTNPNSTISATGYDRQLFVGETPNNGGVSNISVSVETGVGTNTYAVVGRCQTFTSVNVLIPAQCRLKIYVGTSGTAVATTSLSINTTKFGR